MVSDFVRSFLRYFRYLGARVIVSTLNLILRDEKSILMEHLLKEIKFSKREGKLDMESARYYYKKYKEIDNLERRYLTRKEYKHLKDSYNSQNKSAIDQRKILYLFSVIPKSSRQEAISDIQELIFEMKKSHCHRYYIGLIITLHIISIVYHALFFKLKGYFYPDKQHVRRD